VADKILKTLKVLCSEAQMTHEGSKVEDRQSRRFDQRLLLWRWDDLLLWWFWGTLDFESLRGILLDLYRDSVPLARVGMVGLGFIQ